MPLGTIRLALYNKSMVTYSTNKIKCLGMIMLLVFFVYLVSSFGAYGVIISFIKFEEPFDSNRVLSKNYDKI